MAFVAKTSTPMEFKAVAATVAALVEEASFEAAAEGISFRAMDPSHVALIDLSWPSAAFEKYRCDKQFKFTVRVEDFVKLIKRAEAKDSVEVTTGEEDTLILRFTDGYKREFNIHLIESTAAPTPLPKITFNTKILMPENVFERILSDISTVSDHVTIESSVEGVKFTGKSDTGTAAVTLEKGSADLLDLQHAAKEKSVATYSIDYLTNIVKAAGAASETVICEYSSKMPLRVEFKLGESGGRIYFYLAPRVEG